MTVEEQVSCRQAVVADQDTLARTFAAAFADDPVGWLPPDERVREERLAGSPPLWLMLRPPAAD